jgi:hypothetical protein
MDTTLRVENNDGLRTMTIEKNNDGEEGDRVAFSLESFDHGTDPETGDVTTAPIVRAAEVPIQATSKESKLSKNQQTMFSLLHDAGQVGLTTEQWNEKARAIGLGVNRRSDYYDWQKALKSKQMVREFNGRWNVAD